MSAFIDNIGDCFAANYFDNEFAKDILSKSGYDRETQDGYHKTFGGLKRPYYDYRSAYPRQRAQDEAPYARLKLLMHYWCALWFWDVRQADRLPYLKDWLWDMANILEVGVDAGAMKANDRRVPPPLGVGGRNPAVVSPRNAEVDAVLTTIQEYGGRVTLLKNDRLQLVREYAGWYEFFYYQLEFFEVFRERGGFDVAVGNPPWLKVQFDEVWRGVGVYADTFEN